MTHTLKNTPDPRMFSFRPGPWLRTLCCLLLCTSMLQWDTPMCFGLELSGLRTVAEASDYRATATHAQVMRLCRQLAEASPLIQLSSMGKTFEGRDQPLLIISKEGLRSPEQLQRDKIICLFAMGNIHAGEVCGKEALLALAREFAERKHDAVLDQVVVLLAPIYNADGNERFALDNRPGQVGPADGMGQRPNAQGFDLNRDHMKLESAEARNLARLCHDWDPSVLIDTHTTNGSIHNFTITYDGPRHPATSPKLIEFVREHYLPTVGKRLRESSDYASFFYGNFNRDASRWETYPDAPRYSTHYFGLRGRIGILSEAYSYASYQDRVLATKAFVEQCIRFAADHSEQIRELTRSSNPGSPGVAIRSELVPLPGLVEVVGNAEINPYDTDRDLSEIEKKTYSLVYMGGSKPTVSVAKPFAYLIPPSLPRVVHNLQTHGIVVEQLSEPATLEVETYRVESIERSERSFQGHRRVELAVKSATETREIPAGWLVAKTAPPLGPLLVNLLEPEAVDGLASWNYLDHVLKPGGPYSILRLPAEARLQLTTHQPTTGVTVSFASQSSGVTASLRGLDVPAPQVAWASGSDGTVIRTTDGGRSWQDVSIAEAPDCDFRDIVAFDADEALVLSAGSPARVYATGDGGKTWARRYANDDPRLFFDAMAFWSRDHGVAFSDPLDGRLFLVHTEDGGETWKALETEHCPIVLEGEAGFAASGTCLAVQGESQLFIGLGGATPLGRARVLRSADRGLTWQFSDTPLKADEASGIFSLAMSSPLHGVAVGGTYTSPDDFSSNLAVTRDGGVTWGVPTGTPPGGYRSCVTTFEFQDQTMLMAVGTNGCDISVDQGDHWESVHDEGYHAAAASPGHSAGWVVGGEGRVARWKIELR